ncbi:MAG: isoaspartyl peptidase/L-asparaginase [bacterium]
MSVVLVHGGAWAIPARHRADTVAGCEAAAAVGHAVLAAGGSAVDAVVAAVRSMEDHPTLSAGVGAAPDARGDLRLDAALVRGADLACGAVAWLPPTRHPIELARVVLDHSPHVLLVGAEALAFGAPYGVFPCDPEDLALPDDLAGIVWGCDTVGAVALDDAGHLASALSTGAPRVATPPGWATYR